MKFKLKREPYTCNSEKEKGVHCLLLWCSDGWRYNLETYKRHRFLSEDTLYCEEETFSKKVFSDVLYHEHLEIILVSSSPKIWIEKGDNIEKFSELQ
jgi:hypothetical protein